MIQMRFASRSMSDTMCEREHDRAAAVRGDLDDLLEEVAARERVQARDGLVENQQIGPMAERQHDRELLPFADGHVLDARSSGRCPTSRRGARSSASSQVE